MRRMLTVRGGFMWWFGSKLRRWSTILVFVACVAPIPRAAADQNLKSLVQQAFDLHQRGQYAEAMPLLRRAYALAPQDYFVNLLLGIDCLRTGDAPASVPFLKEAARLRPKEEYPLDYLGEALAKQEMYGEAVEAYIRAVQVSKGSAESSVAFVDFALSRFASMSTLLRSSKKGLAAEYRLRALALPNADALRASLFERAADLDPSAPGIWSDLALSHLMAGELSAADSDVHKALLADGNDLSARMAEAQLAAQKNEWKQAIQGLDFVLQRSPSVLSHEIARWPPQLALPSDSGVPPAAAKLFSCVREGSTSCEPASATPRAHEDPEALFSEQKWEQLLKLPRPQPDQTDRWFQRGVAFALQEDCPQAIPALERGLTKSSPGLYGMFLLTWCYSRQAGRTAEQVQESSGGDDAPLHVMRGDILLRLQAKADMAIAEYQQALTSPPNDPSVLERIADAQFGAGQVDAARQSAQAALKIDPQRISAKRTLARIAMQERDYAAAIPVSAGNCGA